MKRALIAGAVVIATAVFGSTLVQSLWYAPTGEIVTPVVEASATSTVSIPERLSIPALGIDARVQEVGVTAGNDMAAPHGFTDVGWYKYGPMPGAPGTAVIAGHLDNGLGLDGVFKHLSGIRPGDSVFVTDDRGDKLRFSVTGIASYPYDSVPSSALFGSVPSPDGSGQEPVIHLVTCAGSWVPGGDTYDHRLVVTAVYQSETTPSGRS